MKILLTSLILASCFLRTVAGDVIGCEQGFTKENDTCIQVLGRSCTLPFSEDPECVDERTWCGGDGTCSCRNGFFEMNGTCVTVLGRNCSWPFSEAPECGGDRTWCGQDSTCSCRDGFIEENGKCVIVIGHNCTVDNDCGTSYNTVCDPDSSICTCREGYALEDDVCIRVLSRSCISDDECPLNLTVCYYGWCNCRGDRAVQPYDICIEVYGQSCQYGCAENMYCTLDFTCTCLPGFFFNGEYCETAISKACVEDNDCVAEGLVCSDEACKCGNGYFQPGYLPSCLIALGSMCEDNPCVDNGDCSTNYCECKQGYAANGTNCVEVATIYGSKCTHTFHCRKLNNSRCDSKGYCQCQYGFIFNTTDCIKVLGKECSQIDCSLLENSICGANNTCVCEESFSEYDNVCSAPSCQNVISSIPDLSARLCLYNMSLHEPLISDHLLREGWYRTDDHHIPTIGNGATINSCGSSYPIVVKDQDPNYYADLTLDPKHLVAVVVGPTYGSEEIDIKVRRCPDGLHYYLKPPKTRPAAHFYYNGGYDIYGSVMPHLRFYQEETEKGLMDKPFSVWECHLSWFDQHRFPTSLFVGILWFMNGVHIQTKGPIRHWNLQTDHFDAYHVSDLELTEFELLGAGGTIGNERKMGICLSLLAVMSLKYLSNQTKSPATSASKEANSEDLYMSMSSQVKRKSRTRQKKGTEVPAFTFGQTGSSVSTCPTSPYVLLSCGILYTLDECFGRYLMLPLSYGYKLSFIDSSYSIYVADTQGHLYIHDNIPIGCQALVTSKETHCNISFKLTYPDGSPVCHKAATGNSDTQPMCGFSMPALTKYGLELGRINNGYYDFHSAITKIHGQNFYDRYCLLFMIQPTDNHINGLRTKIHFQKAEPLGQNIFDNYKFPPIEIGIVKQSGTPAIMKYKHVQHQNQEIQWNVYNGLAMSVETRTLHISMEGEYLLLRSTDYVFQVHGEMRNCNEAKLCLCGVHIQYNNDIYMYRFCGGHLIVGFVLGSGDNFPINRDMYRVYAFLETPDGLYTYIDIQRNDIGLTLFMDLNQATEGIYSIDVAGKLQGRDGVSYDNGADFLQTWRLPDDESLLNPANYRQYRIVTEYAVCGCPSPTTNIPSPVVTYEDGYWIHRNVYTGVIQCQMDQTCTEITEGEVWKSTLLPDFVIKTTAVTTELLYTQNAVPVLVFRCMFNLIYGYKYKIVWYVNDILLKKSDYLLAEEGETFTVTDGEIYNSNKVEFALDMKIQCSANVFDLKEIAYGEPVLSQAFYPFEIISNDIALIRGRNAKLSVKVNIPKMCPKISRHCDLLFQVLDTSETHTCKDSTIAMLGKSGCGTTLNFMSIQPTSTGEIIATTTITTKNNNKYRLKNFYDLRVKVFWIGAGKSIWNGFLKKTAEVTVHDTFMWRRHRCYSHVDPYMRTFDGRYYDIQLPGEFILFRHTTLEIEIQTIIKPCYNGRGWWVPFCSCGVIMRAGRDVYSINHCNRHVTGYLSADDKILRVYRRNLRYYQVRFPTGMYANVFIRPWFHNVMDIDIYPTPADAESIEGLCGNFNGDTGDDLKMRNGSITNDTDQFAWSWGLLDSTKVSEESLRLPKNYKNQSPWKQENQLCVCQDPNSLLGGAICSANEEETCSSTVNHKGYSLFPTSRLKRDARYINLDFERRMTFDIEDSYTCKSCRRLKRSTNYAISLDTAREMCEEAFKNCTLSMIEGTPVDRARHVEECAKDVAVNGTLEWYQAHCEALGLELEQELDRDEEYAEQNPEIVVITSQTLDCSDCSGNGDCVNGTCQCNPGFGSDICLVNLSRIVEVAYIFGDGYCDMSVDGSCQDFIVESDGFVPDFSALVDVREASKDGVFRYKEMQSGETTYLSYNEGIVSISNTGDQPSTSADDTTLAYQFGISVSNNGVDFGNPKYVTVYDSRCQEISYSSNGEIIVILKSGTCFIEGTCYKEDDRSPSDDCLVCKSSINRKFDWTTVNCVADESSVRENVVSVYAIIVIVLGSILLVPVAAVVIAKTCLRNRKPVVPYPRMPEYCTQQPIGPKKGIFFIRNDTGKQRDLLTSQCGMEDNNDNQNGLNSQCGIQYDNDNQFGLNSQYRIEHDNGNQNSLNMQYDIEHDNDNQSGQNSQYGIEHDNDNQSGLNSQYGIEHDNYNQSNMNSQYGIEHDNDNQSGLNSQCGIGYDNGYQNNLNMQYDNDHDNGDQNDLNSKYGIDHDNGNQNGTNNPYGIQDGIGNQNSTNNPYGIQDDNQNGTNSPNGINDDNDNQNGTNSLCGTEDDRITHDGMNSKHGNNDDNGNQNGTYSLCGTEDDRSTHDGMNSKHGNNDDNENQNDTSSQYPFDDDNGHQNGLNSQYGIEDGNDNQDGLKSQDGKEKKLEMLYPYDMD